MQEDKQLEFLVQDFAFSGLAITTAFISFGVTIGEEMRKDPSMNYQSILDSSKGFENLILDLLKQAEEESKDKKEALIQLNELRKTL
jgi:hypothetical protein